MADMQHFSESPDLESSTFSEGDEETRGSIIYAIAKIVDACLTLELRDTIILQARCTQELSGRVGSGRTG